MAISTTQKLSSASEGKGQRDKDQEEDDGAAWTVVQTKSRRRQRPGRRSNNKKANGLDFHSSSTSKSKSPEMAVTVTVTKEDLEHIAKEHAYFVTRWRADPAQDQLRDVVQTQAPSHVRITQAVCLGAGSFGSSSSSVDAGGEHVRRAHVQTEVFLMLAELASGSPSIPCYFQEPLYSAADKQFLEQRGSHIHVVEKAVDMIDETTLVFGVHLPTRAYMACLEKSTPAMLVGTRYDVYDGDAESTQALSKLKRVDATYSRWNIPHEKHDYCFSDTCIYWRKADV